jgi:hypothetical protein
LADLSSALKYFALLSVSFFADQLPDQDRRDDQQTERA